MAKPIPVRPDAPLEVHGTEELAPEIASASEALRDLLELLRLLEDRGILRFGADLLREEDRVLDVVTTRIPAGDLRRAARNLEVLVKTFRDLDPITLAALARGVPRALDESHRAERSQPMGFLEIARALRDPDVNRGVRMVLGFLRGIGARSPG